MPPPLTTPFDRDPQLVPLADLIVSLVDRQRAERGLRPLSLVELGRFGRQVATIVFPVCTQAEPEI